ncbi:MAG: DUF4153 domain-containing protein [Alistipes sp.]
MNVRLKGYLSFVGKELLRVLQRYPVELSLMLYGCVGCLLTHELNWTSSLPKLALAPLFAVLALVINQCGQGAWRRIYWLCWLPLVPLSLFWSGLDAWMGSLSSIITFGTLLPLSLLMCRRAVANDQFVCDVIVWLRSGALAVFFANVTLGLFCAILYSTTYIFGLSGTWIGHTALDAVILTETFVIPLLLLVMIDGRLGMKVSGSRIIDVLLNYIVTPALLIYTAILYLYVIQISIKLSLPQGGIAYLVFWFTLLAIGVRALQFLLRKRLYNWFFDRFSLIALPLQVLFWIGVIHRIGEYGFTPMRVFLVVCGGLMTLCVLLFFSQRTGRYLYLCAAGFVSFAALAYLPVLQPEQIAIRSQVHRAEQAAKQLNLRTTDGAVHLELIAADTAQQTAYLRLYESLTYLAQHDSAAFANFGVDRKTLKLLSSNTRVNEQVRSISRLGGRATKGVSGYNTLYTNLYTWSENNNPYYSFKNDTLRIDFANAQPPFVVAASALLERQLQRIGAANDATFATLQDADKELLTYSDDQMLILFSDLRIERRDSVLRLTDATIDVVMTR